jgi:hypothetical protein
MAYLNESQSNERQTPLQSQPGRSFAVAIPSRQSQFRNTDSPPPRTPSHQSRPLTGWKNRHPKRGEVSLSSPKTFSRNPPITALKEPIAEQSHLLTLSESQAASETNSSHSSSTILSASNSRAINSSSSRQPEGRRPPYDVDSELPVRTNDISNANDYANEEAIGSQVEYEMDDDEVIHGLTEAKAVFSDGKLPDFVIRKPGENLTRDVMFRSQKKREDVLVDGELIFEFWDDEQKLGFWTLTDDEGFTWIVKYFLQGQQYRIWMGVGAGYHENIVFSTKRKSRPELEKPTSQGTVIVDSGESEDDMLGTARRLRKRNIDQVRPYSTERTNYKRSKDGMKEKNFKREFTSDASVSPAASKTSGKDLDRRNKNAPRPPPPSRRALVKSKPPGKSDIPSGGFETKATPSPTSEPAITAKILNGTTLYVFLADDFDFPPTAIYLKSCRDVDQFFSVMALAAGVEERDIRHITVRFDWLPESKPNTIRMIRGLADSYDKMMEEIREAPAWKKGGEGRASVFVNVVSK